MITKTILYVIVISFLAFSWDGQRKGFIAGIEVGNGIIFWQPTYSGNISNGLRNIKGNFNTNYLFNANLKLGCSIGNKFAIQNYLEINYFNQTPDKIGSITDFGFDFSYYFLPNSPSYFINTTLGYSSWSRPINPNVIIYQMQGMNISFGFGKEIIRHFYILLRFIYTNGGSEFGMEYKYPDFPRIGFGEVMNEAYGINLVIGIFGY